MRFDMTGGKAGHFVQFVLWYLQRKHVQMTEIVHKIGMAANKIHKSDNKLTNNIGLWIRYATTSKHFCCTHGSANASNNTKRQTRFTKQNRNSITHIAKSEPTSAHNNKMVSYSPTREARQCYEHCWILSRFQSGAVAPASSEDPWWRYYSSAQPLYESNLMVRWKRNKALTSRQRRPLTDLAPGSGPDPKFSKTFFRQSCQQVWQEANSNEARAGQIQFANLRQQKQVTREKTTGST